jgi:hypothetical protein
MRLLFLCGSLDPGRDGVGDYVRTLSASCAERGVEVRVLALNDHAVSMVDSSAEIHLRLPAGISWRTRIATVLREVEAFEPDWISLQFVPYAFHPRGLAQQLHRLVRRLPRSARRHIMFHETWITCAPGASWKRRLMSFLQRRSIRGVLSHLKPEVVHTSTAEYQSLLAKVGARAELLPIFGSIPIAAPASCEWLWHRLAEAGVAANPRPLLLALFGSIYPEWEPAPLMQALRESKRRACFISIGNLREGAAVWESMARAHAGEHDFVRLGPLTPGQVSEALSAADLGVTPMPLGIIEKSSTAAAMLEHGLPVLVTRFDPPLPADEIERLHRRGIYPVTADLAAQLQTVLPRRVPKSWLPEITELFLTQLGFAPVKPREAQPA